MKTKLTKNIAQKVLKTVDAGLCSGLGEPKPSEMCVEAAICFALGMPHGDKPTCVGSAVRDFKIALNDSTWSSNAARANGMRKLAIAQLGSDSIDQQQFAELLALKTIQQIAPKLFTELAQYAQTDTDKATLTTAALNCAEVKHLRAGLKILSDARDLALARDLDLARARDEALTLVAEIGLQCLIELKSPGCEWLFLCEEKQ